MTIGDKIRQLRIHKRMTQDKLVEGICSVAYLSRVENGKLKPSRAMLERIVNRLDISLSDLLNENISEKEKKIKDIIQIYQTTKNVAEEELNFLNISTKEPYPSYILVQIFGLLIRYYIDNKDIARAEQVYQVSQKTVSMEYDNIYSEFYMNYYISCGILFYTTQIYSEADRYFTMAENLIIEGDTIANAKLFYNISLVKQRILKDKTLCLYYSKKAYDIFLFLGDTEHLSKVLITRGVQCHLIKDYKNSLVHLLEARENIDLSSDTNLNAMIEYNLGRVYQGLQEFDKSIAHFHESIKINESLDLEDEKVYSLKSLIEIYQQKKQWDLAHNFLQDAIKIAEDKNLNFVLIELKALQIKSYYNREDYFRYEKEMQKIIEQGIELKQNIIVSKLAMEFAQYYYELRAYKKAADYFKIALNHDDYLSNIP
ncbi:helix-turn-helix transcriptional regulator [Bacillus sp. CECT 9360]|uniref:helix-turn-helix domain-containing protein n=1 Tax=Bacillus sp. CECT 9360 TaxID=2845821 RepID=UPI001EF9C8F6|nr:helix-turn-helix transcriptional regulator [Bacillus sp. CECT 9360]CAH0346695.1 hypothetical protein BCI9360_03040 [Bacillus sp. CECT 9360]